MCRLYAAYGSNLHKGQMAMRCPDAIPLYVGYIKNHRIAYSGHGGPGYLTIEKSNSEMVPVVVWKISEQDEKNLDMYEGYPRFYEKKLVDITIDGETDMLGEVFAYYQVNEEYKMPTDNYVFTCIKGYKTFNMDMKYLDNAWVYTKMREGNKHVEDN